MLFSGLQHKKYRTSTQTKLTVWCKGKIISRYKHCDKANSNRTACIWAQSEHLPEMEVLINLKEKWVILGGLGIISTPIQEKSRLLHAAANSNHHTTYSIYTCRYLYIQTEDGSPYWFSKARSEKELHSTWCDDRKKQRQQGSDACPSQTSVGYRKSELQVWQQI